ncbi:MAG: BspA family leucine-rich repeat surface protein [Cytophagaceae bacterium]
MITTYLSAANRQNGFHRDLHRNIMLLVASAFFIIISVSAFAQPPVSEDDCGRTTLYFNSSTDVSATIHELSGTNQGSGTWEAWIKKENWSSYGGDEKLFMNDFDHPHERAFYISLHSAVGLHFRSGGGPVDYISNTSTFGFSANSWHHFAATWSESEGTVTTTIFIDGVAAGSTTSTSTFDLGSSFYLGGKDGTFKMRQGEMAEVRVWNVARTEAEIADNKNLLLLGDEDGLVAYWPLDEAYGSTTVTNMVNDGSAGTVNNLDELGWRSFPLTVQESGDLILIEDTYDFGTQMTNESSDARVFTITNLGTSPIDLSANPISALTGDHADQYALDLSATATELSAGASTTFSITFSPTSVGVKNAVFSFANVSACSDPYTFNLTGISSTLSAAINIDAHVSIYGHAGGELTVSASGGTAPYTYLWSNSQTTTTISDLTAGEYTVTVTDAEDASVELAATITQPEELVASIVVVSFVTTVGGNDGALTASATGGVEPYTYLWSNEATTASITDLEAGQYSVTITDDNGATSEAIVSITDSPFITTWKTDNTGSSNDQSITIGTTGTGYNYTVYWEEVDNETNNNAGAEINFNDSNTPHTIDFGAPGIYRVKIYGDFPRSYFPPFSSLNDKLKILTIEQWGDNEWTSMLAAFAGCSNLTMSATDAPNLEHVTNISVMFRSATSFNGDLSAWDVSGVTNIEYMFQGATSFNGDVSTWDVSKVTLMRNVFHSASSFNGDLSTWDVSSVTNMFRMFSNATSFNGDLSAWDVSKVTEIAYMFDGASSFDKNLGAWDISSVTSIYDMLSNTGLSTKNYDNTLIGWATLDAGETRIPTGLSFRASGLTYCNGSAARATLTGTYIWTITGDAQECLPFITTWQTSEADESITIPTTDTGYSYTVDWGDGSTDETIYTSDATHEYAAAGTYTVTISGDFPRIYFNNSGDKEKILTVEQWGDNRWTSMARAFEGCGQLSIPASDIPNLDQVTDMSYMFSGATAFNDDISAWDVRNVTNMSGMFNDASAFNQTIGNWDVRNVTDMSFMFNNATAFDQPIGSWDISSVTSMNAMLNSAGLSTAHYDATLMGWAMLDTENGETQIPTGITLNSDGLTYSCEGAQARATLIDTYSWFISGDEALKCNQTIIFEPLSTKTFGDDTFELTATGGESSNAVIFISSDETVATISGSTVTIIGAGTATITASQEGNDHYTAATSVEQVLTINKATAEVAITDLEQETDSSAKEPTITTIPGGLNYTITYDGSIEAPSEIGSYDVVVIINEANYEGTATATFVLTNVLGIISGNDESLILYPNPAAESFEVKSVRNEQIMVFDLNGRFQLQSHTNTMTDISMLSEGVYLVKLSGGSLLLIKQ